MKAFSTWVGSLNGNYVAWYCCMENWNWLTTYDFKDLVRLGATEVVARRIVILGVLYTHWVKEWLDRLGLSSRPQDCCLHIRHRLSLKHCRLARVVDREYERVWKLCVWAIHCLNLDWHGERSCDLWVGQERFDFRLGASKVKRKRGRINLVTSAFFNKLVRWLSTFRYRLRSYWSYKRDRNSLP